MQETRGSDRCNRPASDLPEACRWRLAKSPNRGVITQRRTRLADAPELTPLTTRQDNAQSEEKKNSEDLDQNERFDPNVTGRSTCQRTAMVAAMSRPLRLPQARQLIPLAYAQS